jgi:hypothetical protein
MADQNAGAAAPGEPMLTIELLHPINHGFADGSRTHFGRGLHTLPRSLALQFLACGEKRTVLDPATGRHEYKFVHTTARVHDGIRQVAQGSQVHLPPLNRRSRD